MHALTLQVALICKLRIGFFGNASHYLGGSELEMVHLRTEMKVIRIIPFSEWVPPLGRDRSKTVSGHPHPHPFFLIGSLLWGVRGATLLHRPLLFLDWHLRESSACTTPGWIPPLCVLSVCLLCFLQGSGLRKINVQISPSLWNNVSVWFANRHFVTQ